MVVFLGPIQASGPMSRMYPESCPLYVVSMQPTYWGTTTVIGGERLSTHHCGVTGHTVTYK
jgi:hypothetical protein